MKNEERLALLKNIKTADDTIQNAKALIAEGLEKKALQKMIKTIKMNRNNIEVKTEIMFALGNWYFSGECLPKSYKNAKKWYLKAANLGCINSQRYLGDIYDRGLGVSISRTKAVKWYLIAAENGEVCSRYNLSEMYRDGDGVQKNNTKATMWFKASLCRSVAEWYRTAAENGEKNAQYFMGFMYQEGLILPQDNEKAKKWYRKAIDQGDEEAEQRLHHLLWKE